MSSLYLAASLGHHALVHLAGITRREGEHGQTRRINHCAGEVLPVLARPAGSGVRHLQHHLNRHDGMLVFLEDVAALLGQFIGAAGGGHAGQQEGQGEKEAMGLVAHRNIFG